MFNFAPGVIYGLGMAHGSCCPGFLWQASYEEHTKEGVEYSLGKEEFGDLIA